MYQLTQSELKKLLHYNPTTGVFVWRVETKKIKIGSIAGKKKIRRDKYPVIGINWTVFYAHRLAFLYMTGTFPLLGVDHINGKRSDNRWVNLRDVAQQQNNMNRCISSNNTSGCMGVSWSAKDKLWCAEIHDKKTHIRLGWFKDKKDAIKTRKEAEKKYGYHANHGRAFA